MSRNRFLLTLSLGINVVVIVSAVQFVIHRGGIGAVLSRLRNPPPDYARINASLYRGRVDLLQGVPLPPSSIVMVGDSLTEWAEWHEFFPELPVCNRGIPGETAAGVLERIESIARAHPRKIFLMIGINDLIKGRQVGEVITDIRAIAELVARTSPTTRLYLESVLPASDGGIRSQDIDAVNRELAGIGRSGNCRFIDIHRLFLDRAGKPDARYFLEDGVHLSAEGYHIWREALQEPISEGNGT